MLIPSNPLSSILCAILSRWYPLVVMTVFFIPEFFLIVLIISKKSFLTVGFPPVRRILFTPSSDKALARRLTSSRCKNFLYHFYQFDNH